MTVVPSLTVAKVVRLRRLASSPNSHEFGYVARASICQTWNYGVKKIAGHDNQGRVRVRDDRFIYAIEDDRLLVLFVKHGHRGDVYRA